VSPGAILAALLWIVGSIGFSIYTANFGKYNETYGTLAAGRRRHALAVSSPRCR
jgi:uncharacterized BrkB/YihY/UPF0761 family membrane protein